MKKLYIIAAILLLTAAVAVVFQFSGTDFELSRYNTEWNGTSDFFSKFDDSQLIYDYGELAGKTNSTLLVIAPTESFGDTELHTFLINGNTIIIADQIGSSNEFLKNIGSSVEVHNEPLRSVDMEYKDTGLFRVDVLTDIYGTGVETLFLNYPGYVTGGNSILETSHLAWVDNDNNNAPNKDEILKVYSCAASDNISSGKVIVIADPSVFINSMMDRRHTENMAVINALENRNIFIDQLRSATAEGGGLFGLLNQIHRYQAIGSAILAVLFIAAGVFCIRRYYK